MVKPVDPSTADDLEVVEEEPTIGRIVNDLSRDVSTLVNKEIQYVKSELKVGVGRIGAGAGLFAGAAFLALLAVIMFSVALAYLIHWNGSGLSLHWAFLIVFALYLLIAGLLAFLGLKKVKAAKEPQRKIMTQVEETKATLTRR